MLKKVLMCLALSGCATTAGIQDKEPVAEFASAASPAALEECLALKLSWAGVPSIVRGEARTIMIWGQPAPALTVTIGLGEPRNVSIRAALAAGARVKRSVQECAENPADARAD